MKKKRQKRSHKFCVLLSENELAMLRAVASEEGVDGADIIRGGIRQKHSARFGEGFSPTEAHPT